MQGRYQRPPVGVQVKPKSEPWCDGCEQGGELRKRRQKGVASWRTGVQTEQDGEWTMTDQDMPGHSLAPVAVSSSSCAVRPTEENGHRPDASHNLTTQIFGTRVRSNGIE